MQLGRGLSPPAPLAGQRLLQVSASRGNTGGYMSTRKEVLRSPLHHPAFRRLWLGLVISRLGDQFTVMSGVLLVPLVFLRTLPVAMLFMSLAGFAAAPYYVVEQSLMQRLVPKNVQGQVCRPEYPYTRMSVKVQKNGLLMLEISVLKLEKVPESALILEK